MSNRSRGEEGAKPSQSQAPSSESSGEGEVTIDDNDILSRLPDHILIHILSFLPTKHVRQTSMLSRRWRHLHKHVPVLDLAQHDFHRCPKDLCAFVSAARCIEGPFHSLKIRAGTKPCWCWINRLNLNENLHLKKLHVINGTRPNGASLSKILAITSLKELHLDLDGHFTWPSDSHMPFLQKLHLQSITLDASEDNSAASINIFPCFPALEDCTMSGCIFPSALVVSGRQLKRFALTYCAANQILMAGDSLVDFSISRCTFDANEPLRVEISAPNIRYFTWECTELGHSNLSSSTFNSLVSASIDVHPGGDQLVLKDMKLLISVISRATRLRSLRLGRGAFEALCQSHAKALESNTSPNINLNTIIEVNTYRNLVWLELWLHHSKIYYVSLSYLLGYCPKLKTLIIHNEKIECASQADHIFEPKHLLLEDLETTQIYEFIGTKLEVSFINSLLRVSKKLTKITIFPALCFFEYDCAKLSLIYQLGKEDIFDVVFPDSSLLSKS